MWAKFIAIESYGIASWPVKPSTLTSSTSWIFWRIGIRPKWRSMPNTISPTQQNAWSFYYYCYNCLKFCCFYFAPILAAAADDDDGVVDDADMVLLWITFFLAFYNALVDSIAGLLVRFIDGGGVIVLVFNLFVCLLGCAMLTFYGVVIRSDRVLCRLRGKIIWMGAIIRAN